MTRLKPATDQVHLWFGMTRHRLPGWSAPFLRGGRFVSPGRGCRAPTPLCMPGWRWPPGMKSDTARFGMTRLCAVRDR